MFEWEFLARTIHKQRLQEAEKARLLMTLRKSSVQTPSLLRRSLAGIGVQLCKVGTILQNRDGELEIRCRPQSRSVI